MAQAVKNVLLIDDDEATNYLHELVINDSKFDCAVHVAHDGEEALSYLAKAINGEYPKPEFIFLDINMPVMDGWSFLETYHHFPDSWKENVVLIMLTSSENPADKAKAIKYTEVSGFRSKPLSVAMLNEILAGSAKSV